MHAIVVTVQVDPDQMNVARSALEQEVVPPRGEQRAGFRDRLLARAGGRPGDAGRSFDAAAEAAVNRAGRRASAGWLWRRRCCA